MDKIILSGKSGAGKDMVASFMKQELEARDKCVLVIHYGDAVKFVLRDYFNWNGEKDEYGRYLLQHIGTDLVRRVYPDFWVTIVAGLVNSLESEFDIAIIPDARFENEINVVEEICGPATCIRIERTTNGESWANPLLTPEQLAHPSETSLDNYVFDYVIHNDDGLAELKDAAIATLEDLGFIEKE